MTEVFWQIKLMHVRKFQPTNYSSIQASLTFLIRWIRFCKYQIAIIRKKRRTVFNQQGKLTDSTCENRIKGTCCNKGIIFQSSMKSRNSFQLKLIDTCIHRINLFTNRIKKNTLRASHNMEGNSRKASASPHIKKALRRML